MERALGSIAAQMSHGRRRMNRLSIEHALFVAAGAALTAFAVLVALAFRLSPAGFAAATWALLAGVVTIALGCARRFHAAWVPSAHAALVIDGRAGLQERLATLCAAGPDGRRSRLWTFLLHENLRLLPTWEPRRLVPRFIPRSVWFFAFALLLAALTAGRIPSSARSAPSPGEAGRDASDQTPPPAGEEGGAESDAEEGVTSSSTFWTDLPQALQRAILGSGSSQQFAGRIPERTSPVHDDRGGPAIVGRRMKNAGPSRSAPASPEAMGLAGAGQADRGTLPAPNANRPSESATSPNPRPAQGDRPKALAADPGRSRPQGSAPRAEQAKGAGG
ncbi:MAG: hypothetical protein HYY35_02845, partial [Deltaproteobacteria bacterium]|nr:hypothetical protein [Deltaproteobacteria bacterium]